MHRLALALGGRTVAEWREVMGVKEFERWQQYYIQEPFGQERDNWHMARLATLYATVHSKKAPSLSDFMYKSQQQTEEEKRKETEATLSALAAMASPKKERNNNG